MTSSFDGMDLAEAALAAGLGAAASLAGDPQLTIIGAAGAPLATRLLRTGLDTLDRRLSRREQERLKNTIEYAAMYLQLKWDQGARPRQDLVVPGMWNSAEELLEGTLLKAQREYQSHKQRHLGHFMIEAFYREDIALDSAFQYLNVADRLTYQQYQLLALFGRRTGAPVFPLSKVPFEDRKPGEVLPAMVALYDCFQLGLLGEAPLGQMPTGPIGQLADRYDGRNIKWTVPAQIYLSRMGTELHDLLGLVAMTADSLAFLRSGLGDADGDSPNET